MKTIYLFLFGIFLFSSFSGNAQNHGLSLIGYANDKVDTFELVQYNKPIFRKGYLVADAKKISLSKVNFYVANGVHYRRFSDGFSNSFYEREMTGMRISTYFKLITGYSSGCINATFPGMGGNYTAIRKELFSINEKFLLSLTPRNLKIATLDCEECTRILNKTIRKDKIRYGIAAAGLGLMIFELSKSMMGISKTPPSSEISGLSPMFFLGVAGLTIPLSIKSYRSRDLRKVINIYNKN